MNVPRPDIPLPKIDQAPEVITSIETGDISIAEIKRAIHRLKNGKSPGIDAISAEMLKRSENDAVKQLHLLFRSMCTRGLEEVTHSESAEERTPH